MITSTAYTFLLGWEGSTAQVTTALRNSTTRSPWLQATVNPWLGYSGIHSGGVREWAGGGGGEEAGGRKGGR